MHEIRSVTESVMTTYARGSEWRRWDLHLHAPGTAMNDQFGDVWEDYLCTLEALPVAVLGITDYFSISTYSKVRAHKAAGRLSNIELVIPNIEFRLYPPTKKGSAVNIHLIVSPDDKDHEERINDALSLLVFTHNERRYSCTVEKIRQLGRDHYGSEISDKKALEEGSKLFKITLPEFKHWLSGDKWLAENSIIVVAAGDDGLAGLRRDDQWSAVHDDIARFSQAIFCSNEKERAFWLGATGDERHTHKLETLGGPKPCIHGSDAHKIDEVGRPKEDRFCWIKADPTFEGLRQILHEPEERVYIGPSSPTIKSNPAQTISSVSISNSGGWFPDGELMLNPSLVAVIGKKGSGKSALAEMIAKACGDAPNPKDQKSFIVRSQRHLDDAKIKVKWADLSVCEVSLCDRTAGEPRVRFLSQSFVEELCSGEDGASKLAREIESIVFSFLDPTEKMSASNFDELRKLRTERIEVQRADIKSRIEKCTRSAQAIHERKQSLGEKKKQIVDLQAEKEGLELQISTGASAEEAEFSDSLRDLRAKLSELEEVAGRIKRKQVQLEEVITTVETFRKSSERFFSDIRPLLLNLEFSDSEIDAFRPQFSGDVDPPIARRKLWLQTELEAIQGTPESAPEHTIHAARAD